MINLKKYKNLIYVIMIFSLIIFTFSLVTSIILTDYKNNRELNALKNSETKYFKFTDSQKISFDSLVQVLGDYNKSNIYLEYNPVPKYLQNNTLFGKSIYYNYNIDNKLPILKGRAFTLDQIKSNEKLILVGKNLTQYIIKENGIDYFIIDDIKYKVIGILGNNSNKTGYDDTFLINMKSMDYYSDKRATWSLNVSNKIDLNNILKMYQKVGINNNTTLEFVSSDFNDKKISIKDLLQNYQDFIFIFEIVFGFGLLNLIIVVYFWIDKSVKEIGVRKAYGATNFNIAKLIVIRYEIGVLISVVIGITLHGFFRKVLTAMFPNFSFDIYIENVTIATVIFMLIGLLAAIIPLIKAREVQPIIIMKGRLK
ncbi:ABC transporter permease [Candidatus Clostridium stratigraminis]|uniref:ABC transporter permease n=1 Tax=Candidatus Clostridium stratigraminis TaxID=3381661 RepID=A0ABW8T746_9CLOT